MNRRRRKQMAFHDTPSGFMGSRLFPNNRWVKLAEIIPWDLVDEKYAEHFAGTYNGNVAIDSRVAFASLLIKTMLNLSDEATVEMIQENPHCQYFLGFSEFSEEAPFNPSKMVAFRQRFSAEAMAEINEAIIRAQQDSDNEPPSSGGSSDGDKELKSSSSGDDKNAGTLLLDATCAPADIRYPTDAGVLNDARIESERLIDELHALNPGQKKPRTYRQLARKNYLRLARSRRPRRSLIRKVIRGQLQYLRRNIKHIQELSQTNPLTLKQTERFSVVRKVYEQQAEMYQTRAKRIDDRIVSVSQPHVRPIVRGKQHANVEFGAKIAASLEEGYARIEHFSWNAFNEASTLQASCEAYYARHGHYPERVLADKIYRNRENLAYCKAHGIALSGPALGRPAKDKPLYEQQKQLEREEAKERNAIEGKFGEAKRCYGLGRVMTRLSASSETTIQQIFLTMNLKKILRDLFLPFLSWVIQRINRLQPRGTRCAPLFMTI